MTKRPRLPPFLLPGKEARPFFLVVILVLLTRFLFLEKTAPFIWDEARDIYYIYKIMHEKFFTLIGPFAESGVEAFGSIYYYLLLPFTVLTGYDPIGPVLTTAIFGSLTVFTLYFLFYRYFKKDAWKIIVAATGWYPLLLTSRWAWNPHLGPFWGTLSLAFWLKASNAIWFFSGLFAGVAFNHHFLAGLSFLSLGLVSIWRVKKEKLPFLILISLGLGFFVGSSPILLFEVRHQFFFIRQFFFSQKLASPIFGLPSKESFSRLFKIAVELFSVFVIPLFASFIIKRGQVNKRLRRLGYYCFFVFLIDFVLLLFLKKPVDRYLFFVLPFFFFWVVAWTQNLWREKFWGYFASLILLVLGITFYIEKLPPSWERSIPKVRETVRIIEEDSQNFEKGVKINVAAIQSPEKNLTGGRYRFMLQVRNFDILEKEDHYLTQILYVVSATPDKTKIYSDPAYEIRSIWPFEITQKWTISGSWYLYRLERRPADFTPEVL